MKNRTIYTFLFSLLSICLWAQPTANFTVNATEGCVGASFTFTDMSTDALTYAWNFDDGTMATEQNPTHIYTSPGTYEVCLTVTDDLAQMNTYCLISIDISSISITNSEVVDVSCAGGFDGSICINEISCGQAPFTYLWNNGEIGSCANTSLAAGTYEVTITDDNGLTVVQNYTVLEPNPIQVTNVIISDVTCGGLDDGSVDFEVVGGTPPYTFMPSNLSDLAAGNYSVIITDNNGCNSAPVSFTINELSPLELAVTTVDAICGNADGTIDLTVTGGVLPYTYNWNDGIYFVEDPSGLSPGLYFVDVTDVNGCVAELDVVIEQSGGPTVTYDATPINCFGESTGSIDLTVTGGTGSYTFNWAPQGATTEDVSDLAAGIYTVTVTDDMGCNTIVTGVVVDDASLIEITVVNVTNATCGNSDGSIDVTVDGGTGFYTYTWSNGSTLQDQSNLIEGDYTLVVTDGNNCTSTLTIAVVEGLTLDAAAIDISCNGANDGAIDLSVANGQLPLSYAWSNGEATEDISGLPAGSYSVTVTDANNCSGIQDVVIEESSPISFSIGTINLNCYGEETCIDASGATGGSAPYVYLWSDGSTNVVNCLTAGDYSLTITDANGCTFASGNISIIEPPLLQMVTNTVCVSPGQADGSITVTVSGGTAPYLYEWENGITLPVIDNLTNGSYNITVTDANGCSVSNNILLGIIEAMGPDTLGCSGGAEVFVIAPTAVSYSWEPAAFLGDPTASSTWASSMTDSTLFTVTVTDADGCEDTGSMWVEFPDGPGVILIPTDPDCAAQTGSIELLILCPTTEPYTYDWADLAGANDPGDRTGLGVGSYEVTVTDDNGLTAVEAVTLTGTNPIDVVIAGPSTICEGENLILCAPNSVGATYSWTGPSGFASANECVTIPNADIGQSGCYTVVVADMNGCTGEGVLCVEVVLSNEIITNISLDAFICTGESTQLSAQLGANAANITFEWTPGAEMDDPFSLNPIVTPSATTTYVLTAVDNTFGCQISESLIVNVIPDCMWPGDTDTNKVVNNFDLLNIGLAYDSVGPVRTGGNMMWVGQPAVDWMQNILSGPNYKHIDSDANGLIDGNDTLAIVSNWGETHNFTGDPIQQYVHDYPQVDGFILNAPFYVEADTLIEGMEMSLPIILGEEMNVAEDVYGVAYSLTYDTDYIVNGSVSIGFNTSWLGENDNNMIAIQRDFPSEGRVDIAMTRIDGMNISDYGQLAQLFITVEDDILFAPGGGGGAEFFVDDAVFNITNVLVINNQGEEIPVIPTETTAPVEAITSNNEIVLADLISIYPNPAKDRIWVTTKNTTMESIRLYDLNGRLIRSTSEPSLDVQNISTGLYLLKVQTEVGVYVEKVMVD